MLELTKKKKKGTPCPKTKKKPQWDGRRGCHHSEVKSHTRQVGDLQTRTIIPKKFSHSCKGSEPHIRLPSLGIQQKDWEFPRNLALRARGIWLQAFQTETPVLEGTYKILHRPRPRGEEQWPPQETEPKLPASVGGPAVEAWVGGRGALEGSPWCKPFWNSPLILP